MRFLISVEFLGRTFVWALAFVFVGLCAYAGADQPCNCVNGKYCSAGTCVPCHVGNYCVGGNEYPCSGNSIAPNTGMASCTACSGISPYANEAHTICLACDYGAYVVRDGVCVACSGATPYSNQSHTNCVACNSGVVENGVCIPQQSQCSPGQYIGSNNSCVECIAGYYCNGDGTKKICAKGTFSSAGQSECTSCPSGYTTGSVGTVYVAGNDLNTICKTKKVALKISNDSVGLPVCLREGRINKNVVRTKN